MPSLRRSICRRWTFWLPPTLNATVVYGDNYVALDVAGVATFEWDEGGGTVNDTQRDWSWTQNTFLPLEIQMSIMRQGLPRSSVRPFL